jgi:hypothetical protein
MPPIMLTWRWFARMYHWPPEVVDALPLDVLTWFPVIEDAENAAQEYLQKQENQAQTRGRAGR